MAVQSRKRATSSAVGTQRLSKTGNQQVKFEIKMNLREIYIPRILNGIKKLFWSIKSLDESDIVYQKFDWTRFILSPETQMENLELFKAGQWNFPGSISWSDYPTSCSKIGEVIEVLDKKTVLRLFKKPKIWTAQLEKLQFA